MNRGSSIQTIRFFCDDNTEDYIYTLLIVEDMAGFYCSYFRIDEIYCPIEMESSIKAYDRAIDIFEILITNIIGLRNVYKIVNLDGCNLISEEEERVIVGDDVEIVTNR